MKKRIKPFIFIIFIIVIVYVTFTYNLTRYFSLMYVKSQLDIWLLQVHENYLLSIFIFFMVYALVTAFSIPGAAIMTLIAGALFGLIKGTIIASFASTLGATISFLIARFFLRQSFENKFKTQCDSVNKGIEKDGILYLFALRMVPAIPFFIINIAMGLTKISVPKYIFVSQAGMLFGTIAYVNVGTNLMSLTDLSGILSPQLWLSCMVLAFIPFISQKIISGIKTYRIYTRFSEKKPKKCDYNIAIIGAGSGGLIASYIAATVKARVVLFEKDKMGGDCLNRGCIPSKALISISKMAAIQSQAKQVGIEYTTPHISFSKVMKSVHRAIASVAPHDSVERYKNLGVHCISEEATVLSPWKVSSKSAIVTAHTIILATGGTPIIPLIPGLEEANPYTSDTIWSLTKQPKKMLVIGGGPVGCELARAFSLLGTSVTLVQRFKHVLPNEDEDVARVAYESLCNAGVTVIVNNKITEIQKSTYDEYRALLLKTPSEKIKSIVFDTVLVAVGRKATIQSNIVKTLDLTLNPNGSIFTDQYMRTSIPNIYAIGDATGVHQFTHVAGHTAHYATTNALFGKIKKRAVDYSIIPSVTFLDPEIGRVGITEHEAKKRSIAYEVTKYEMKNLDRALAERKTTGFIKVLTPPNKDTILGVAVVAERSGEILGEFILAMQYKIGLNKILATIHPYPTFSEAVKATASTWKKAHAPKKLLSIVGSILTSNLKKQ